MPVDLSLGYEVLIQPVIYLATGLFAAAALLKGRTKETITTKGGGELTKRHLAPGAWGQATKRLVVGFLLGSAIVTVPFGFRGVIWSAVGGVSEHERVPGVSLVVPLLQHPVMVDVRTQALSTVDADGKANSFVQNVSLLDYTVRATVNWHIDPDRASELIDEVGPDYADILIRPNLYKAAREGVGDHTAEQLAEHIEDAQATVERILTPVLAEHGIIVETISLEDVIPPTDFSKSVEEQEIADREANEQENLVRARTAEKKQRIIAAQAAAQELILQGQGEGRRIQEIASALGFTPQEYIQWLTLMQWNGQVPQVVLGDSTQPIIPLPSLPEPVAETETP